MQVKGVKQNDYCYVQFGIEGEGQRQSQLASRPRSWPRRLHPELTCSCCCWLFQSVFAFTTSASSTWLSFSCYLVTASLVTHPPAHQIQTRYTYFLLRSIFSIPVSLLTYAVSYLFVLLHIYYALVTLIF